ncbi:hypothetical protein [Zunongwangia profunda]|uniref:hypothetical protein n=1 Tax=Zunongwangia profunda TaxID=398743 RepID=UPI001D18C0E2|nr:hypothetical protein [Zunongwangia profunda]MCC4228403.1 hypothetical protein [Zunongwangia profunda]
MKSKKSAFLISLYFRHQTPKKNPKPNGPKYNLKTHKIPLVILLTVKETIQFLDKYTDFDKFSFSDYLQKKLDLKNSFCIDIKNWESLQNDVLWKKQGFAGVNFFEETYNERLLDIRRLPLGLVKRELFEDLF